MEGKTKTIISAVAIIAIIGIIAAAALGGWFRGENFETLTITGSTTVQPIVSKAAEVYMDKHSKVDVQVSGGGSSHGIQAVGSGVADIGMASRQIKSTETQSYPGLVEHVIAKDGIAVIVHPSNSINSLTLEGIRGIFNGTYTDWSQVGGASGTIVVVNRDSASGTREFFWKEVLHKDDFVATAQEYNSNGGVKTAVSSTPLAIGYVGLGFLDATVKDIEINVDETLYKATVENVLAGTYPISRNLYVYTKGEPTGLSKEFIDFILSDEGQQIVEDEGFIPLS
jgi:phosphate transport system substrate-binding protein